MKNNDHGHCPKCGYPSKGQYENNPCFGIYCDGHPCGGCGYIDEEAEARRLKDEAEKDVRVKKLRENPPQFKSVEDWEKWDQEEHLKR
jgi:hypothetical protein